jgi:hypothetical protein
MAADEERVETIALEITRYLVGRPDAADTFDGISHWWLARIRLDEGRAQVQQALDRLVQRNVVTRTILPDGNVLYRSADQGG